MDKLLKQLHQLAPLAAAATAGPWQPVASSPHVAGEEVTHSVAGPSSDFMYLELAADAAFIAAARNLLTPENLTLLIGLLGNMESVMDTSRVLANRLSAVAAAVAGRKSAAMQDAMEAEQESEQHTVASARFMEVSIIELALNPQFGILEGSRSND